MMVRKRDAVTQLLVDALSEMEQALEEYRDRTEYETGESRALLEAVRQFDSNGEDDAKDSG